VSALVVRRPLLPAALLLVGFALAVAARVLVGGSGVAQSATAGLLFAAVLGLLCLAAGIRIPLSPRAVGAGLLVAVVLCVPVVLLRDAGPLSSPDGFVWWAAVVGVVAVAEEVFLRGALYDAVRRVAGADLAILVGAVAFAVLHVPLYGWHVVPLDLVVGLILGELRRGTGTAAAPAVAHVGADWAAWFLR